MMTDLLLARVALRDALRPRRLLTAFLLIALPSAVAFLIKLLTEWDPEKTYDSLAVLLVFGFTLTILAVVHGTGVIGQEMEQRTIVYLVTRPLARWRILLAKSLVSFSVIAVISILSLLLLALVIFGPVHIADADLGPDIRALIMGSLAYGALFVLLGALLPRPLLYGLLFVFGWENIVPRLPGSFAKVSVMIYLKVLAARELTDAASATQNGGGDSPANFLLSFTQPSALLISNRQAWVTLLAVTIVALVSAMIVFTRREYTPREDAE